MSFIKLGFISDDCQIDTLVFNAGNTLEIHHTSNPVIADSFLIKGSDCGQYTRLVGNGGVADLSIMKPHELNYIIIENLEYSGTVTINLNNSFVDSLSTGWYHTNPIPKELFWIGRDGDWSDGNNCHFLRTDTIGSENASSGVSRASPHTKRAAPGRPWRHGRRPHVSGDDAGVFRAFERRADAQTGLGEDHRDHRRERGCRLRAQQLLGRPPIRLGPLCQPEELLS